MVIEKTYIINLDRSVKRWQEISKIFKEKDIEVSRFAATDGYEINIKNTKNNEEFKGSKLKTHPNLMHLNGQYEITCDPNNKIDPTKFSFNMRPINEGFWYKGQSMSAGELGIWCSNVLIWKDIVKNQRANTIVFEDDARTFVPGFKNKLDELTNILPKDYDINYLRVHIDKGTLTPINNLISKFNSKMQWAGLEAYTISLAGAQKLLNQKNYNAPIDVYLFMESKYNGLESYTVLEDLMGAGTSLSELDAMGRH